MTTETDTAAPAKTPHLAIRIILGLFTFAACVLGFVFLAPYGIWWVGTLSFLVWIVPSLVFKKSLPGPWVGVAMALAAYDLHQGTFFLAAWFFGIAATNTLILPPLVILVLLGKFLISKLEKKLDEWEAEFEVTDPELAAELRAKRAENKDRLSATPRR